MLRSLIELVAELPPPLLVALAAGLAFGETAILLDLLVPGEAGLVVIGAAGAASGVPVWVLALAASVGSAAGDTVSFLIGRHLQGPLNRRFASHPRMVAAKSRAAAHFERHGGVTVFIGRWIGALRAVVPFVAGSSDMRLRTFLAWNVAASLTWASTMVVVGYELGATVADRLEGIDRWLSLAAVAVLAVFLVIRRRPGRAEREAV